jgi:hypothetical protein
MPIIIKRPRARSDLSEIWDYIAADSETREMPLLTSLTRNFRHWPTTLTLAVLVTNWKKAYGAFRLASRSFFTGSYRKVSRSFAYCTLHET